MNSNNALSKEKRDFSTRNHQSLKLVSLLIRLSAIVPVFFAILTVITTESQNDSPGALMLMLCVGGIAALLLFAAGSMIRLVMEIAANLARILNILEDRS